MGQVVLQPSGRPPETRQTTLWLSDGERGYSTRRGDFDLFSGLPLYAKLAFGPDLEF